MFSAQEHFRDLFTYNVWAHGRVWDCVQALDAEQFVQDTGYSLESVRNQLVHVMSVDRRWWTRIAGIEIPPHLKAEDYPDVQTARAAWRMYEAENAAIVSGINEDGFARVLEYDMPHRGGLKHNTVAQVITHIVNHGTDHRAQTLSMLHRLGAPTVEQDIMFYWWDVGSGG